ncbi:MAG: DUF4097 family beta strand repeat protein [Candidatus Marinimicrobia bacterium]|nr:DUF4097 family beta strand repeat protein [Candidatus Neomarinimicrobiota bacterium]
MRIKSSMPWVAVLLVWALAGVVVLWAGETETRSFQVKAGGTLTIDTERGSIEIVARGRKEVTVQVTKKLPLGWFGDQDDLNEFIVEYDQSGDDVTITGRFLDSPGWGHHNRRLRVHYKVTVPEKYNLDLETSGGSITVSDLEGKVEVRTSGGSLTLGDIDGPVNARTSGGSISLSGSAGRAELQTSGGGINVGRVGATLEAKTSGGSIHVKEVQGAVKLETSGGGITATITGQPKGDCSLKTSGGGVTVYLSKDVKVNVNAKTSGGNVSCDLPIMVQGLLGKTEVKGKINGGGPELYLRTSGGSIKIHQR